MHFGKIVLQDQKDSEVLVPLGNHIAMISRYNNSLRLLVFMNPLYVTKI